jgi:hypothetical protein
MNVHQSILLHMKAYQSILLHMNAYQFIFLHMKAYECRRSRLVAAIALMHTTY